MSRYSYNPFENSKMPETVPNISEEKLHMWTKQHMYRTSYADSYDKGLPQQRNSAMPGYGGYIPGLRSRSEFGKTFTQIAQQTLSNPETRKNKFGLSSTGFNLQNQFLKDDTLSAESHKFGTQTIQKPHPSFNTDSWETQTQATFKDPASFGNPCYRPSEPAVYHRGRSTQLSGYATNNSAESRWLTMAKDKDPNNVTEYRAKFNKEKPVQPSTKLFYPRKLRPFKDHYDLTGIAA